MATSSPKTSIEDMVMCAICMERMESPKHLHCQHAFCEDCLKNWTTQSGNSKRSISCPVCRHVTPIRKGVHNLPGDIGVTKLLDMLDQQKRSSSSSLVCGKDGGEAVAFCAGCSYHLCRDCVDEHVQNQTLWPHLLYLDDVCCSKHAGVVQDLYCQQCDRVGCGQCMTEQHNNHTITHLADIAGANRDSMQYLLESLEDVMYTTEAHPQMLSSAALESRLEELKLEIKTHASKHHTAVDLWKKAILTSLKQTGDNLTKEVSCVESQMEPCRELVAFISRFLLEASDYQLVAAFSASSQKLQNLTDSLDIVTKRSRSVDYDLAFVNVPAPQSYGSLVNSNQGSITEGQPQAAAQRESFPRTMEFDVVAWEISDEIEKELHYGADKVRSHNLKRFTQWLLGKGSKDEDLEAPVTVFMSNHTGKLYVGASGWWTPGHIVRYSNVFPLSIKDDVMFNIYPKAIAVSPTDGTIVASVGNHLAYHENGDIDKKFDQDDGDVYIPVTIRNLPSIKDPYGIAIANDNRWVIIDQANCLVGVFKQHDGLFKHIATYGNRGDGPGEFYTPTYVCYDSVRDRFIVSDTGNNRIQVFSMPFTYLWEADGANSGRVMRTPRGVCLDGSGNILVADTGNTRIAVFAWQTGNWLKDIELDFMPHSVTVDGRGHRRAYLVVAGLRGKMPVITTLTFKSQGLYTHGWWQ